MLFDITSWAQIEVRVEFTSPIDPAVLADGSGLPMVSLLTELQANQPTEQAARLRDEHGRIPYSSPLYWWELRTGVDTRPLYIGQTVKQQIQRRFERHGGVMRLLARYANEPAAEVFFRMCSRLDLRESPTGAWCALEWLAPELAGKVVADVEAELIFDRQPEFNVRHKRGNRRPWKPTTVVEFALDNPPLS